MRIPPLSDVTKDFLAEDQKNLINGQWVAAESGETLSVLDPARGVEIARIAASDHRDIDAAVAAARNAFESGWGQSQPMVRETLMLRIAELIEQNADLLSQLEVLDNGMPMNPSGDWAPGLAAKNFSYYGGWCDKITGETLAIDGSPLKPMNNVIPMVIKEPVGVVGQIIPWNFPLTMAAMKIAPALAAGCTVVMKPAELAPLSTIALGRIFSEAGLPDGVVNIVSGLGADAGAPLANHPDVDKIAFTGSTAVGKQIVRASAGNLKRVSLELGGKNPFIVFADADIDEVVQRAVFSTVYLTGQNCQCSSRIYVHQDVHDEFLSKLKMAFENIKVGWGFEDAVFVGPLISEQQRERVKGHVEKAVAEGATIITGGKAVEGDGYFFEPTILADVSPSMSCVREEIFGPVTAVQKFDDTEAVFAQANDTVYGLVASVWTNDLKIANRAVKAIRAGTVSVNNHGMLDFTVPFGGMKQSGWGREMGGSALNEYLEEKSVAFVT